MQSHPIRVRGLKFGHREPKNSKHKVAPHTGAWIEILNFQILNPLHKESHPIRVRGLKFMSSSSFSDTLKSHPIRVRGLKCFRLGRQQKRPFVAPHTGAWIEISVNKITGETLQKSHPIRVRGLK